MGQRLTILSVELNPEPAIAPTGTFSIRENYPGADVVVMGSDIAMSTSGILVTPVYKDDVESGKTYRVKCLLNCGTSFAKLFTIPVNCPAVENLSVQLLGDNSGFAGLKILFSHVSGFNNYQVDVYKIAVPGEPGSVFINSYNALATTGEIVLTDTALFEDGSEYFVRISLNCVGGFSEPSDFVTYTPNIVNAVPSFNPIVDPENVYLSVDIDTAVTEAINFTVYFKLLNDQTMGPYYVEIQTGNTTGETVQPLTPEQEAIGVDPESLIITEVIPNQINNTLILF